MEEGIILPDSPTAQELGFTSDKFDGYLWFRGKELCISFIVSREPGKGNFKKLIQNAESKGLDIFVPTPFPRMVKICRKLGFIWVEVPSEMPDDDDGTVWGLFKAHLGSDS